MWKVEGRRAEGKMEIKYAPLCEVLEFTGFMTMLAFILLNYFEFTRRWQVTFDGHLFVFIDVLSTVYFPSPIATANTEAAE